MLYAHTLAGHPKEDWQTLQEHLENVGRLAADFASLFGAARTGATLGTHHDAGKATEGFQRRLEGGPRVDHSTAGAVLLGQRWEASPSRQTAALGTMLSRFLAYPILGHHGGLPDAGSEYGTGLDHRLAPGNIQKLPSWDPAAIPLPASPMDVYQEMLPLICKQGRHPDPFRICFALRMLFSCLVDADYLDTERFCTPDIYRLRPAVPALSPLAARLEDYLHRKGFLHASRVAPEELEAGAAAPCGSSERQKAIALARSFIREQCEQAAAAAPGLFSLTVPTGGGKTLSSLSFAIRHAIRHDLRRIIFVVPYTSIIEQNAQIFREALGDEVVLEHHSNFVHPDEGDDESTASLQYRLSTENWEAAVIVTTSVQFFESLFSCKPSRCRKLHNIARSVVILDEAQMIPVPFVAPCVEALRSLAGHYGTSIVLCTATQPALEPLFRRFAPELHPQEITPDAARLYEVLRRTTLQDLGTLPQEEFAARLANHPQVLCVVNRRKTAQQLYAALPAEGSYCLTTLLCAADRRRQLDDIRQRLKEGLPCRVVSTSLIEAGVDVDFPVAYREQCGLDSLLQTAGRCNREGRRGAEESIVYRFRLDECSTPQMLRQNVSALDYTARHQDTLDTPRAIQLYFNELSDLRGPDAVDKHGILDAFLRGIRGCQFPFAQVAEEFRLIENAARTVYLPVGEGSALCEQLRSGHVTRTLLRKLGVYSVSCYKDQFDKLDAAGALELRPDGSAILTDTSCYSEKTGLAMDVETGIGLYF